MTIYDIAKELNLSSATISKVINNYPDVSAKTRERVQNFLKEINFHPNSHAQTLSTKKSWMMGVVYYEETGVGLSHPYFSSVIDAFKKAAEAEGYSIHFGSKNSRLMNDNYLDYFRYRNVDGIVVFCTDPKDKQTWQMIESEMPVVIIDMKIAGATTVNSANESGCEMAVSYLTSLGHTKIAHIAGCQGENWVSQVRERGFIEAMDQRGLPVLPGFIQHGENFSYESGYQAMKNLLTNDQRPTAVFAASDLIAAAAIAAIRDADLCVPEDISVIGFDDIELAKFLTPKLTTVRQDTKTLGKKAAQLLINHIDKQQTEIDYIVPVEFIIRESCQKI
ncbi:MAG: LacI family DNA-binding transcriptional regulator [Culicoidibacterales bacterium]